MFKRILVPVDFSAPSLRALDYAVEAGRPGKAEIILVHAVEPLYFPPPAEFYAPTYDAGLLLQQFEQSARQRLAEIARRLEKRRLKVRSVLRVGSAHAVIVEAAKRAKADLIVISTHGRTGLPHVLLGSVAEKVVRHATTPVLTVRGLVKGRSARGRKVARRR